MLHFTYVLPTHKFTNTHTPDTQRHTHKDTFTAKRAVGRGSIYAGLQHNVDILSTQT